ncbi:MAG TPA: hypothetical protein DD624_05985 [Alphaproteobacteria bacterium]|nr:hypothetical protein [Alphaproteobacteria bacterium]
MNSFFKTFSVFFLFPFACFAQLQSGSEMKRIAYSAENGVEVFAESMNGHWCESIPNLKIFANDETVFSDETLTKLTGKVGIVLENDCPEAEQIAIDGYVNNSLVYQGAAEKIGKWKPEKGALKVRIRQLQIAAVNGDKNGSRAGGWTPPAGDRRIEAHIDDSALEYRIYSKNKSCSILYTTDKPARRVKSWSISVGGNSCAENLVYGRADVSVFDENGSFVEALDGYFTEGRFTGRKNLNVVLLNRYGAGKNIQNMSYLIDSDNELKIQYVGYMKAPYNSKTKRYAPWQGCSPFTVAAVTENDLLFLEPAVIENILRAAQSYADIFCPSTTEMRFFAATVPQGIAGMDLPENSGEDDENLIYAARLTRKRGRKWVVSADKTQNLARIRESERRAEEMRENQLMTADYNELLKTDYFGRLAYMTGVDHLDNLPLMTAGVRITGKPRRVNLLLRIRQTGTATAIADWPSELPVVETDGLVTQAGWHLIGGNLRLATREEQRKLLSPVVLEATSSTVCQAEACSEVSDLTTLIRRRFEKPNWQPFAAEEKK